ncbi:hypothetical protein os1_16180 [Comamonadaceae bacterium OS-1]|nr:hypothetical protein os1_16180 [Comamonadaceae bacterium OS-1]
MDEREEAEKSEALGDEVLRKLGRNLLLCQQVEALLKTLVAQHYVDGTSEDFSQRQQHKVEKVQNQTMGQLVGQYSDGILEGKPLPDKEMATDVWMSFRFTQTGSPDFHATQLANLKMVVDERNALVHHFLPRWQPASPQGMAAASAYLDQQHEKLLSIRDHLRNTAKGLENALQTLARFMATEECERSSELVWLQNSPLVAVLRQIAIDGARPDGWTYVADAGRLARVLASDAMEHMQERYGHATLKRLLVASEIFDVKEEPLPNCGSRTLYRVKQQAR